MKLRHRQETQPMPSADNVAERPDAFRIDPATGLSEQRSGQVASERRFGHFPVFVALGTAATAAVTWGVLKFTGNDAPAERTDRVNEGTSQTANPNPTETVTSPNKAGTLEIEEYPTPSPISVDKYPDPASAVKALAALQDDFLNDYDAANWDEDKQEAYFSAIYGDGARPDNFIKGQVELQGQTGYYNDLLRGKVQDRTDGLEVPQLKWKTDSVEIVEISGDTVTVIVKTGTNRNDIPKEYGGEMRAYLDSYIDRENDGDEFDESHVTYTLGQQNGNWVIVNVVTNPKQ